eukprot:UC4_evm2s94
MSEQEEERARKRRLADLGFGTGKSRRKRRRILRAEAARQSEKNARYDDRLETPSFRSPDPSPPAISTDRTGSNQSNEVESLAANLNCLSNSSKKRSHNQTNISENSERNDHFDDDDFEECISQSFINDVHAAILLIKGYFLSSLAPLGMAFPNSNDKKESRHHIIHKSVTLHGAADILVLPIILKHQLRTVVPDGTSLERELDYLCAAGVIKLFALGPKLGDISIVLASDYRAFVCAKSKMANEDGSIDVVSRFVDNIVLASRQVSISKKVLENRLSIQNKRHVKNENAKSLETASKRKISKNIDEAIALLFNLGLLSFRDEKSFWFTLPNAGLFMKCIRIGREAALKTIKRSKFKELSKAQVCKRIERLSYVKVAAPYIIADLVGAGELLTQVSTTGTLLRIRPDKA